MVRSMELLIHGAKIDPTSADRKFFWIEFLYGNLKEAYTYMHPYIHTHIHTYIHTKYELTKLC
jgi:hypothetical protein